MSSKVSKCLQAAGISKVVWIDDKFASPTRNDLEEAILKAVVALKERGDTGAELATFGKVDLAMAKPQVEDATVELCEPLSESQLEQILAALGVAAGTMKLPAQADLSDPEFQELESALGDGLRKFSWNTWTSTGITEFRSANADTLFLIDKEFTRENTQSDGIDILDFLIKNTRGLCIMLTQACSVGDQEQRRMEFAKAKGILPHSFCVVSKLQSVDFSVDDRFAMAVRTAMTHKFNGGIAYTISNTIQESAMDTATALTSQSVSDLERVLFENADEEGVFEYDAVLRIFEIQQRHALNAALAEDGIQKQLQLSRKFREATEGLEIKSVSLDMGYFRDMRAREMFFEGTGLNKLHSPLSCGDVFKAESGERYVLLAQPCDLMVRKDGERKAEVGFLTLMSESNDSDAEEDEERKAIPDYRFYDLKDVFGKDQKSIVNFRKMFAANLAVLDLAVLNSDGSVQLQREQPVPSIVLSRGWNIALKKAKGRIFWRANKPPKEPSIGIGSRATNLAGVVSGDKNQIRYPLRRIGRLQPATATAVLAAWATFQTRAAFDHDFAKEKESKSPASGRLANTKSAADESTASLKSESAIGAQTDPTILPAAESATLTQNDPQVNASPKSDSSASASPPSIG